jgi:hypothetical protein
MAGRLAGFNIHPLNSCMNPESCWQDPGFPSWSTEFGSLSHCPAQLPWTCQDKQPMWGAAASATVPLPQCLTLLQVLLIALWLCPVTLSFMVQMKEGGREWLAGAAVELIIKSWCNCCLYWGKLSYSWRPTFNRTNSFTEYIRNSLFIHNYSI